MHGQNHITHFKFNNIFRNPCSLRDNVEKYDTASQATDDNTIRRVRLACSMNKGYRHTHGICNTACFSTVKMVTRTRHDITSYTYIACLVYFCLVHKILFTSVLRIIKHYNRFLEISSYFRMIMDHISSRLSKVRYILKSIHRINTVV